ncbi:MAG: glycosyltransferase family 4 protein [Rhizobiales bacterium]|nr:glycosyltransferase family 4 protein [Hyphomicrobiales bacterium]
MRFAFVITSLFPTGGLQRDCVAIAELLSAMGHEVTIVTTDYREEMAAGAARIEVWQVRGLTKTGQVRSLSAALGAARDRFDRIVAFSKVPGADIYYCADPPRADIHRSRFGLATLPGGLTQVEGEIFGPQAATSLIVLAAHQVETYRRAWATPESRFRILPPTLAPARRQPEAGAPGRAAIREALGVDGEAPVWLAVASAPRTKGMDRTVEALPAYPAATLLVAGTAPGGKSARWITRHAAHLSVDGRVKLLGYREDMPLLMAAADVLVHPARRETTGTTILEALASGLPVITTAVCGYAPHVANADAGVVLAEPFRREELLAALARAANPATRERWSRNGLAYGSDPSLSTGLAAAAELMAGPLWA